MLKELLTACWILATANAYMLPRNVPNYEGPLLLKRNTPYYSNTSIDSTPTASVSSAMFTTLHTTIDNVVYELSSLVTETSTATIDVIDTDIVTITSCSQNQCKTKQIYKTAFETATSYGSTATVYSTYLLSTTTHTLKGTVTEFTTWCPLTQSTAYTISSSSVAPAVQSTSTFFSETFATSTQLKSAEATKVSLVQLGAQSPTSPLSVLTSTKSTYSTFNTDDCPSCSETSKTATSSSSGLTFSLFSSSSTQTSSLAETSTTPDQQTPATITTTSSIYSVITSTYCPTCSSTTIVLSSSIPVSSSFLSTISTKKQLQFSSVSTSSSLIKPITKSSSSSSSTSKTATSESLKSISMSGQTSYHLSTTTVTKHGAVTVYTTWCPLTSSVSVVSFSATNTPFSSSIFASSQSSTTISSASVSTKVSALTSTDLTLTTSTTTQVPTTSTLLLTVLSSSAKFTTGTESPLITSAKTTVTVHSKDETSTQTSTRQLLPTTVTEHGVVTEYSTWCPLSANKNTETLPSVTLTTSSSLQTKYETLKSSATSFQNLGDLTSKSLELTVISGTSPAVQSSVLTSKLAYIITSIQSTTTSATSQEFVSASQTSFKKVFASSSTLAAEPVIVFSTKLNTETSNTSLQTSTDLLTKSYTQNTENSFTFVTSPVTFGTTPATITNNAQFQTQSFSSVTLSLKSSTVSQSTTKASSAYVVQTQYDNKASKTGLCATSILLSILSIIFL